jgi:hypothetical protein
MAAVDQRQPKDRFAKPELLLRLRYSSVEFQRKLRPGILRKPRRAPRESAQASIGAVNEYHTDQASVAVDGMKP